MIRRDRSTSNGADLEFTGGTVINFQFSGVQFPPGSADAIEMVRATIQNQLDERQKLNTLPNDDPDRQSDPGLPNLFWDGPGQPGNTDLVSRSLIVTVTWDGEKYQFSCRRAGRV